jgi:acetyl esterase/lipase
MEIDMNSLSFKLALALLVMLAWSIGDARGVTLPQGRFCTPPSGTPRSSLPANMCFQFNIAYGSDPLEKLDVYMPGTPVPGAPVILMVHGGGWWQGDKFDTPVVRNKVEAWVPTGAVFISVNYPLVPNADPLQQALSVAKALAYAQRNASQWSADPDKFIVMGFSAGAHLVSLLAADPALATSVGARPWLGTVALDSAAYDVPQIMNNPYHPTLYDDAFGTDAALWNAASPMTRLRGRIAPFLAVCTTQESYSCPPAQEFVDKAASYGSQASLLPQDLEHGQINGTLGLPSAYTTQVAAFMAALYDGTLR